MGEETSGVKEGGLLGRSVGSRLLIGLLFTFSVSKASF